MEAMGQGRALASTRCERVERFGEPTSHRPAMPSMPSRRWGVSLAARLVDPAEPIGDCRRRTRSRSARGRRRTRSRSRSAPRRRRTQTPTAPRTQSRSTLRRSWGRSHLEIPPLADFAPRRLDFNQAWLRARIAVSTLTEALLVVMQAIGDLQDEYDRQSVASDDDLE